MRSLPEVPYEDIGTDGFPVLVDRHRHRLDDILRVARRQYTIPGLWLGDSLTRRWLERQSLPYRQELEEVVEVVGAAGAWMLNFSYEWGCTAAAVPDADGSPRLLRVMDWHMAGLGRTLIAVQRQGPAGPWVNFTWPGFIGVIQATAPGRFALCLNQAPPPETGLGMVVNWIAAHADVWQSRDTPPALLARTIMDCAPDFDSALQQAVETPLSGPAFITLVGVQPGEAALVERTAHRAVVHRDVAITNHWRTPELGGPPTSWASRERLEAIRAHQDASGSTHSPFSWLAFPILNGLTRVALETIPATGAFWVQGWEPAGPGTAILARTLAPSSHCDRFSREDA